MKNTTCPGLIDETGYKKCREKWTKQQIKTLLSCEEDAELLKTFPGQKLETLRRLQRKFKPKKTIILPDIHHPFHNKDAICAVFKFVEEWKPDRVVLLGDAMDMRAIDHWKKEKGDLRSFEGVRLLFDYQQFDKEILKPIETLCPNAEKIYMGGNHEDWVNLVTSQNPQLEGMVELEKVLNLAERNWKWIPYIQKDRQENWNRGIFQIGKLLLLHGHYTNKYHAAKTADTYSMSCVYGHTHDLQLYTKVSVDDARGYHTAQSIGCLSTTAPAFLKGRLNRWVNAFGALETRATGHYNLTVPVIIKGEFTFNGKNYSC